MAELTTKEAKQLLDDIEENSLDAITHDQAVLKEHLLSRVASLELAHSKATGALTSVRDSLAQWRFKAKQAEEGHAKIKAELQAVWQRLLKAEREKLDIKENFSGQLAKLRADKKEVEKA